jgi:hypothetical protein
MVGHGATRDRRRTALRWGGRGSWRLARAHCIQPSLKNMQRSCTVTQVATTGGDAGRRGRTGRIRATLGREQRRRRAAGRDPSRWREPVCCRGHDVCWMGTNAGIRKKGAWWMPWRWRPRKDAATRRNAPGRRWQPAIRGCPNGATRPAHGRALTEQSGEGTGGTETSQYPEEQRGFP